MSGALRGEAGQVAGIEAVPFGLLVLAVGGLVVAHTWAVVDAKLVATTAAREASRTYVEAPTPGAAETEAQAAARRVVDGAGRAALLLSVSGRGRFGRCRSVEHAVRLGVPGVGLPWRPDRPAVVVDARHREVVDPYRDGLGGSAQCPR